MEEILSSRFKEGQTNPDADSALGPRIKSIVHSVIFGILTYIFLIFNFQLHIAKIQPMSTKNKL